MQFKSSLDFGDPRNAMVEGIVAVGGKLDVATLYTAYAKGIFPWPQEGYPMLWFCPDKRGILEFKNLHVPQSLQKFARKNSDWKITINQCFEKVIHECAKQKRPGQHGTWILPEMEKAYLDFFKAGFVVSVEVWQKEALIGGVYGVLVEGVLSAESMFYKKSNASKIALWNLIQYLQSLGHEWMDIQMITPVTEQFGGRYVHRDYYLMMLEERKQQYMQNSKGK